MRLREMSLSVPEETLPRLWQVIERELIAKRRALTEDEIRACVDAMLP
jgi:hypothetical protein